MARRPIATASWRGVLWTIVIAIDFFLMSNPLVFVAGMDRALTLAAMLTGSALIVTASWVKAPKVSWSVLLFLGWLLLTGLWSIQPSFTASAWAQTAVVAAVAVAIQANVTGRVLAAGFAAGGALVSGASIYAFWARLPGAYDWPLNSDLLMSGVGTNQNILAYTLTLALCGACAWIPRRAWSRVLWAGSIGLIGYGLLESHSATGALTGVVVVGTAVVLTLYGPVSRRFLQSGRQRVVAGVASTVAVIGGGSAAVLLLGKSLFTFSDRTPLWSAALAVAQERPWGGYGYGAVWQHPWKPPLLNIVIDDIWTRSGMALSHGHNSLVDLVVEVGVVGVLLMVLVMVSAGMRATALMHVTGPDALDARILGRFVVLCLVNLALYGITEPMATIPLGWWALVLITGPKPVSKRVGRRGRTSTRSHDRADRWVEPEAGLTARV